MRLMPDAEARERASAFDLASLPPGFVDDPYPVYHALRMFEPVRRMPDGSLFLTRHGDLERIYKDTTTFSSDKQVEFKPKFGDGGLYAHHTTSLVFNDPPLHTRVRRIMSAALTPRAIARMDSPQVNHGEIWLDHQPLHKMKSHEASAAGIGLVPEDRCIIPGLTVEENLQLAQIAPPIGWSLDRLYELFPRLKERRKQEGVTLSGGEQQMLAVARALARDIKVLLLDEPYEGLAPVIVDEIEKTLNIIKAQGITTVIVEQNAIRALELADRAVILDTGGIVFDGTAEEVLNDEALRAEYLAI
jgi:branched-chain amino acid transport system ATP-binding protein